CPTRDLRKLRVVKVGPPLAHTDVGDFTEPFGRIPIRPLGDGSFLVVTAAAFQVPLGVQYHPVGARYHPGKGELQTFGKLNPNSGDFDPDCLLAVGTSRFLETELIDLKAGAVRLKIDNHANYRPPSLGSKVVLGIAFFGGVLVVVTLVILVLGRSRRRADPG